MEIPPIFRTLKPHSARDWLKGLVTRNVGTKAASLAIAVVIWGFVQQGQSVERSVFAEVAYTWSEDLVVAKPPPSRVRMRLSGSRTDMRRIEDSAMKVVVDMSDATEGVQTIDYAQGAIEGLPSGVRVEGTRPSSAQMALEPRLGRSVPVEVAQVGTVDAGLRLREIAVEPAEVLVSGPSSVVKSLSSVYTEPVALGGVDGEYIRTVALNLRDQRSLVVEPKEVEVRISVESRFEKRLLEDVPVLFKGDAWSSASQVARIEFSGPREAIRDLNAEDVWVVLPAPSDLPLAVNSVSLGEQSEFPFRVLRPENLEVLTVEPSSFELVRRN
ncbi:MAG: CdaR family protein [Myxococcota bacterium]|nr:CdaR family protein [Myxococcota bacterium]